MKASTIAKILIVLFVVMVVFSGMRACARSARVITPTPQAIIVPQQGTTATVASETAQQVTVQIPSIEPLQDMVPERVKKLQHGAILEMYDSPSTDSDVLPSMFFYSEAGYNETDVSSLYPRQFTKNLVLVGNSIIFRMRFLYYAKTEGTYIFAAKTWQKDYTRNKIAVKINGVQVGQLSRGETSGTVNLKVGYYDIDVRIILTDISGKWDEAHGYRMLLKQPHDAELKVLEKTELYYLPEEKANKANTEKK